MFVEVEVDSFNSDEGDGLTIHRRRGKGAGGGERGVRSWREGKDRGAEETDGSKGDNIGAWKQRERENIEDREKG